MEQLIDLVWLAGILDGEGNFHLAKRQVTKWHSRPYLDIKIRVSNTDLRMIKRIGEIYSKYNLCFHYANVNFKNKNWKNALSINVGTQGSARKLLELVVPYLVNRKKLAQILLETLNFIKNFPKGGNTVRYNYWEDKTMIELLSQFQKEKSWYFDPSTTTRKANTILVFDDIV